jgi:hypothetical protein
MLVLVARQTPFIGKIFYLPGLRQASTTLIYTHTHIYLYKCMCMFVSS